MTHTRTHANNNNIINNNNNNKSNNPTNTNKTTTTNKKQLIKWKCCSAQRAFHGTYVITWTILSLLLFGFCCLLGGCWDRKRFVTLLAEAGLDLTYCQCFSVLELILMQRRTIVHTEASWSQTVAILKYGFARMLHGSLYTGNQVKSRVYFSGGTWKNINERTSGMTRQ